MREVGQAAGLPAERIFDLQVVVSEAVANAIEHAASEVEVAAWLLADRVIVEITNDGAFRPGLYKDDEHRRRGLGLPLMVSLADEVHVNRMAANRTQVSLTFFLQPKREGAAKADVPQAALAQLASERLKVKAALVEADRRAAEANLSEERYRSLFENMPDGFAYCRMLFDEEERPVDFVYLAVNPAFERLTGLSDVVGKPVTAVIPGIREANPEVFEIYGRVATTGRPEHFELDLELLAVCLSIFVYSPEKGYFVAVFEDTTERKRAEAERERLLVQQQESNEELAAANEELQVQTEELAAQSEELQAQTEELQAREEELALQNEEIRVANEELTVLYERERESTKLKEASTQVNQSLTSSLDHSEILTRALREGARALGAESAVLEVRAGDGWDVSAVYRLPRELLGRHLSRQEASVATAMHEADSMLAIADSANDARVNASTVARYGTSAVLALPISYQSRTIGSLQFLYTSGSHRFSPAETDFAQKLAVSVALALENARLFETQRNIAQQLQQPILEMPASIPHLRFSHLYRPATEEALVGGDFYDVFALEDGTVVLLIGDVSGHGLAAARVASMVKASLAAFAQGQSDPDGVLTHVNRLLLRKSVPGFTSLLLALFDPETASLTYCSAGHPDLLIAHASGAVAFAKGNHLPLGVFPDWSCSSNNIKVEPGDTLLLTPTV